MGETFRKYFVLTKPSPAELDRPDPKNQLIPLSVRIEHRQASVKPPDYVSGATPKILVIIRCCILAVTRCDKILAGYINV